MQSELSTTLLNKPYVEMHKIISLSPRIIPKVRVKSAASVFKVKKGKVLSEILYILPDYMTSIYRNTLH